MKLKPQFEVEFKASGRGEARCPANPAFPNGVITDVTEGADGCWCDLPYPAPECGSWIIHCTRCNGTSAVTAAGRSDDPIRVRLPCKRENSPQFSITIAPELQAAPRQS